MASRICSFRSFLGVGVLASALLKPRSAKRRIIGATCRRSLTVLTLAGLLTSSPVAADDPAYISFGTGGVTGVYHPVGAAICEAVNRTRDKHGVRCTFEATSGSVSNLEDIKSGGLEFIFAQSDWLHHAFKGTSIFSESGPNTALRSVFSMHREVATIVVPTLSDVRDLEGLKGRQIAIGVEGSGSAATWETLVDHLDWSADDKDGHQHLGTSELAEALCGGEIDAYFVLIGHPAQVISETLERCQIRFLPLEGQGVDALIADRPYYQQSAIPAGLYSGMESVPAFGVSATLATSSDVPERIVETVSSVVLDNFETLQSVHPVLNGVVKRDLVPTDPLVPLHPGALKVFQERGLLP